MTDKRDEETTKPKRSKYLTENAEKVAEELINELFTEKKEGTTKKLHPRGFLGIRWGFVKESGSWKIFFYGFMILIIYQIYYWDN